MAELKIYGIAKSRAFRTLWAAAETGTPYDQMQTNWTDGSNKTPEFLAINPMGSVPAIKDGDVALSQSLAINLYVAKKYGKNLYPAALADEARTWQWTLFAATELERNAGVYVTNRYVLSAEKRDGQAADKAAEELKKPLGVLNQVLGKTSYLLGSSFTVADMNVASVLYGNWYAKSDLLSPYPQVKAWLDRCLERPAAMAARKLREG